MSISCHHSSIIWTLIRIWCTCLQKDWKKARNPSIASSVHTRPLCTSENLEPKALTIEWPTSSSWGGCLRHSSRIAGMIDAMCCKLWCSCPPFPTENKQRKNQLAPQPKKKTAGWSHNQWEPVNDQHDRQLKLHSRHGKILRPELAYLLIQSNKTKCLELGLHNYFQFPQISF